MIRFDVIRGVARAETRLTLRLVRFWVFQSLAFLLGVIAYLYYGLIMHRQFSSLSSTAALLNPRYLMSFLGIYYLLIFLFGLIFLGFDVRARDTRERMVEVLDALPCSNMEWMLGRFLGILIPSWLPVIFICIVLYLISMAVGAPVQAYSLIGYAMAMALPAYSFTLGLTFVATLVLRHRLLAAIVLVLLLIGVIIVNFRYIPIRYLPLVDITGGFSMPTPTDMMPVILDARGALQRGGVLLVGVALAILAAAIHPRRDDSSRGVTAGIAVVLMILGFGLCSVLVWETQNVIDSKAAWRAAHEARRDDPAPDVVSMTGNVRVDPGRRLEIDLALAFRAPADQGLETALFSLNPGLEVTSVTDAAGQPLTYQQGDGMVDVSLASPLAPGEPSEIRIAFAGTPEPWFSYLDSVLDPFTVAINEGNVFILGFEPVLFDRRFVALLPGIRWLPGAGAEIGRSDPKVRSADFYDVDLTVDLPEGWLAAGPGRRQDSDDPAEGGRVRFRFAPPAPLPDVSLIASRYESRSMELDHVTFELLLHPEHAGSMELFADAVGEIRDYLQERMEEAAESGLAYPYDGLTMVEVPGTLRGYAGGWRMDTTLTQPTQVLIREAGFPTARFDVRFSDPEDFRDREGGMPRAKRETLERFFENDFSGGNPFVAAARSFFSYQTRGGGTDGVPLDFVFEQAATQLVTEKTAYFSVHHYGADMSQTINRSVGAIFTSGGDNVADAIVQGIVSTGETWETVLGVSLADLDPWEDPKRTVDVLTLKGGAMARSMQDELGREKTGQMLATLRERTAGRAFDREDVLAVGEEIEEDLSRWLDVWIDTTQLPGFTIGEVRYHRLTDSEDGTPRYQFLVTVRNEEQTPGLIKLDYRTGEVRRGPGGGGGGPGGGRADRQQGDPVRVDGASAVDLGLVSSEPINSVRIVPYLALNRQPFAVVLPTLDEEKTVDEEPFTGSRPSSWSPADDSSIIVDDLDEGFSVEEEVSSSFRFRGRGDDERMDNGLPISDFRVRTSRWSRMTREGAHGKYRHTMAVVSAGGGDRRAIFSTEIPTAGSWELQYYLPDRGRGRPDRRQRGTWKLTVIDESGEQQATLDADGGEGGWNTVGNFEIADGQVSVEVSDDTDGRYVLADAIRWVPARSSSGADETGEGSGS